MASEADGPWTIPTEETDVAIIAAAHAAFARAHLDEALYCEYSTTKGMPGRVLSG